MFLNFYQDIYNINIMKSKSVLIILILSTFISACSSGYKEPPKYIAIKEEVIIKKQEIVMKDVINDPIEPLNRVVFSFNNVFDRVAIRRL